MPRYIIVKLLNTKDKDNILKAQRQKESYEFVTSRPKRINKGNSLNRKETIKEGKLNHRGEEKTQKAKILVNTVDIHPPLQFSKLCLVVEEKL